MSTNGSEREWEMEAEDEVGASFGESEDEAAYEGQFESEWEGGQVAGEAEAEAFYEQLVQLAGRTTQSPALQGVATKCARAALEAAQGEGQFESEWESEGPGYSESMPFGESDRESRVLDEMMEHLGHAAAQAESEDEAAEAFLPLIPMIAAKLLPLAAKAIPMVAKVAPKIVGTVMKSAPQMTKAVSNVARTLFRQPGGRQLVRTVPTIARRAAADIAKQVAQGRPVPPQAAVRAVAKQASRVLSSPQQAARAMQRSRVLDKKFHRSPANAPARRPRAAMGVAGAGGGAPATGVEPAAAAVGAVSPAAVGAPQQGGGCGCRCHGS